MGTRVFGGFTFNGGRFSVANSSVAVCGKCDDKDSDVLLIDLDSLSVSSEVCVVSGKYRKFVIPVISRNISILRFAFDCLAEDFDYSPIYLHFPNVTYTVSGGGPANNPNPPVPAPVQLAFVILQFRDYWFIGPGAYPGAAGAGVPTNYINVGPNSSLLEIRTVPFYQSEPPFGRVSNPPTGAANGPQPGSGTILVRDLLHPTQ